jgi:transcriptional regulator with XRE-family HTH domain
MNSFGEYLRNRREQLGLPLRKVAARLLINRIEGREKKEGVVSRVIKTELVVKESTKPVQSIAQRY